MPAALQGAREIGFTILRSDGVFKVGQNCFSGRDCIKLY
jgi:hypothetical protein